jgi:GT2 family glycosyltransferase
MAIRGHVDGMEGSYAVGWAAADPDTGNCAITIVSAAGETITKGRASRHRPDLAALGLGRTTLAFRIVIPDEAKALGLLHILADGEELTGSPLRFGTGVFDGGANLEGATFTGWAGERVADAPPARITVINQHGVEVGRAIVRAEAQPLDPLFNPARFVLQLDDQVFGAGEQMLSVRANGVHFAAATCNLSLAGNLEVLSPESCAGWLLSPDVPGRNFEVEVYRDGILAGTAKCEHTRMDVRGVYPDCSTPGFGATLDKPEHAVTEAVTISLRFKGSSRELFDGPYVLGNRAAAVQAAYRVARLGNLDIPGLGQAERAVLNLAIRDYLDKARAEHSFSAPRQASALLPPQPKPRLAIIIPIYKGVEITQACIESVLLHRNTVADQLILINDCSPQPAMAPMLEQYRHRENVVLLTNEANLGFVKTVNRGFGIAQNADVILLNSDTVVHAGAFDELIRVAYTHADIGTVTAISNNATIFSYPSAQLRRASLPDVTWPELAAHALRENAGLTVDVPTGHGFCMFIKGEVTRRIGVLDEGFGRGYGEENDFCARSAAFGYRHVAAGGVLVEHKESISFTNERASLLAQNLPRLNKLYPEYTPIIMDFERVDGMRTLRWGLDRVRLHKAREAGKRFVLVVSNALEGGTAKAIRDIESEAGYGGALPLFLHVTEGGLLELKGEDPVLQACFLNSETAALFAVLDAAAPSHVFAHQMLGFPASFVEVFIPWLAGRHSVFWAHDFYPFCPRVTMIDAIGRFCDVADADTCARCVEMGGAHETSVLTALTPAEHRDLFARLLGAFTHVVAPSANTARYFSRAFPAITVESVRHPESLAGVAPAAREGSYEEIVLLGAIGPHKGSDKLLDVARRARITHPHLHFRIIGYTNIDKALKAVGNVTITGKYKPDELETHLAETAGRLALFLANWPETYSYTLSELGKHGFIPLVPEIGAPAERVRNTGYGVVFPFPFDAETVLRTIDDVAAGRIAPLAEGAIPAALFPGPEALARLLEVMKIATPEETAAPATESPATEEA